MHLHQVKSKNATSLYIIESIYTKDKKRSSRVVKKLGTLDELSKTHADPLAWGTALAKQMTEEAKAGVFCQAKIPKKIIRKSRKLSR